MAGNAILAPAKSVFIFYMEIKEEIEYVIGLIRWAFEGHREDESCRSMQNALTRFGSRDWLCI
ncbi:MAG TPA: hypothetical protein DCL69_02505 [Firmicutes bacterium]|nr:hypothetical protein [Bacillota bacterium]